MPNRILRDWTDSEAIDVLSVYAERFFTRLIMKADDYGRYTANLKMLKSTLFPLKTDVRETDITRWLSECEQSGLIALYNIASKEYLQIENFKQVLRQKHAKYPEPHMLSTCVADDKQTLINCFPEKKRNEVETEVEKKGKFFFSLNELEINNSIEYLDRTAQKKFTTEQVLNFWEGFKIQYGNDYKTDRGEVIKHFRNWLKKQENGKQLNQTGNKSNYGQSAGAISLIERVKEQINQR